MKVLIINVSLRPESEKVIFPIGLGYVATAISKEGFDLEILDLDVLRLTDEELDNYLKKLSYDVVAMGCIVTGYKYVKKITECVKRHKDVPIIVGNTVASSVPHILLNKTKADIAVFGEGDVTIIELLHALKEQASLDGVRGIAFKRDNEIVTTSPRNAIEDLDSLDFIDYDLFDMSVYLAKCKLNVAEPYPLPFEELVALPINTARGCPFSCTFCYHAFINHRYRVRHVKHICEEMRILNDKYNVNFFQFSDELSLFSIKQVGEFADYLLNNNIRVFWDAACRADLFKEKHLDLLKKIKECGCVTLGYSLESADENILRKMNKKINVDEFIEQTRVIKKAGIMPVTSLVIGYPEETEASICRTFDVCLGAGIYPSTGYLLPQPGTPIYDYALEKAIIKDEEEYILNMGDRQDFYINLTGLPREKIEGLVKEKLMQISRSLKLGLSDESLIKTGHYRQEETC